MYKNYNFENLELCMRNLKSDTSDSNLNRLKMELNKFFKGATCSTVMVSKNAKRFYGMCVIPTVDKSTITHLVSDDDKVPTINRYAIDIDSRLFDINLNGRELTAVILHEIGHLVNTPEPVKKLRDIIHSYLEYTTTSITLQSISDNYALFAFGVEDALNSITSIFKRKDEEVLADEFAISCGYGEDLNNALYKISRSPDVILSGQTNKLASLEYAINIFPHLNIRRIHVASNLAKASSQTGSKLQVTRLDNLARRLRSGSISENTSLDALSMVNEASFNIFKKIKSTHNRLKYKQIALLQSEFYELSLKVNNVDEHDDALSILRSINSNINIIDDYLATISMSKEDDEMCNNLRNQYIDLRSKLSEKETYDGKYYGLFVKTPEIKSRYEA